MTTIISPITSILSIIVLMTILAIVLFRIHRGRFSETTTLLRLSFLILATDVFATLYLMVYYYGYMPYLLGQAVSLLGAALVTSFCLGVAAPIDRKRAQDDVWTRWFKERNEALERQRTSDLTHEE